MIMIFQLPTGMKRINILWTLISEIAQTDKVDAYLDRTIGRHTKSSFRRSRIKGVIALDDPGFFYIKKYPGHLRIKIDKEKILKKHTSN